MMFVGVPTMQEWIEGVWNPSQKEQPMDRTEEIKALREFNVAHGYDANDPEWLERLVGLTKNCKAMFSDISLYSRGFLRLLARFDAVEYAGGVEEILWSPKNLNSIPLCASGIYRLLPSYTLPNLKEETPPRFKNGTWVLIKSTGYIFETVDRKRLKTPRVTSIKDWCAVTDEKGTITYIGGDYSNVQELPPMPDTASLWDQGYRLTMQAADCSKPQKGRAHVTISGRSIADTSTLNFFKGWRWLAEKIETPPRFKSGTWLVDPRDGFLWGQVVDRDKLKNNRPGPDTDWCAIENMGGSIGYLSGVASTWKHVQELPPMPDKKALAEQGWELTMKAACIDGKQQLADDERWVDIYGSARTIPIADPKIYNGWRWLVRKLEKKEEPTTCTISFPVTVTFGEPVVAATEKPEMFGIGTAIELLKDGKMVKRSTWDSHLIIFPSHPDTIYWRKGESQGELEMWPEDALATDWIEYTE